MTSDLRARVGLGAAVGAVAGVVTLGPALAPGYLLMYDMVFVPHLALNGRTLGTDGSVPRAVPSDLVVALLSHPTPGWIVQKILLLAVFVLAGAGVAALVRSPVAAVAGAVAATWNPYVAERLAIGHWAFLLGYALLPWLAVAAGRARRDRSGWPAPLFAMSIAMALTGSTGAAFGVVLVLCVLLVPATLPRAPLRSVIATVVVTVLANATWWYPFLVLAPHESGDPAGVSAFMARADTPYGTVASLITGGGIWNRGVWFADRHSVVLAGVALVATLVCVAVFGARLVRCADPVWRGVALAGVLGLVIAAVSALPGGHAVVTAIVTHVPGGGLVRDSQKFVALWWVAVSVGVGYTAEVVWRHGASLGAGRVARVVAAGAVALWPLVTLPGLAWGAQGTWRAVDYPAGMLRVASYLNSRAAAPGDLAVFPWTLYRRYPWNGDRVLLDPWQRLVAREVAVNDDLPLSNLTVRGEDSRARVIGQAVASGGDVARTLRSVGVRWVVIGTDQPDPHQPGSRQGAQGVQFVGARIVLTEPGVRLLDLGSPTVSPSAPGSMPASTRTSSWLRWPGIASLGLTCLATAAAAIHRRIAGR